MSYSYDLTTPYRTGARGLTKQQLAEEFWDVLRCYGSAVIDKNELDKESIIFTLQEGLSLSDSSKSLMKLRDELESLYPDLDIDFHPLPQQ